MKVTRRTRLQLQLQKAVFVVLLLCASGLLAWLSQQYSVQFDWTASQRNSLSQGSIDLLESLPEAVVVNVYTQDDATVKTAVEEILKRYQRVKSDFRFSIINPDIDIELAQQDEISQYGQVIIKYQGRREVVSSLSEQTISSALQRLSRGQPSKLVFLEGHGERDPADNSNTGYLEFSAHLQDKGIHSQVHNLLKEALPDDTGVLVIAAPAKPLLEGEVEHIKNYIDRGGNLLWLVDPGKPADELSGLQALAELLEVEFLDGIIVDNNANLRQTLRIQHPAMIPVLDYYPHAITRSLDYNTLFPISRGVKPDPAQAAEAKWSSSIIAQSLPRSWSESSALADEIVFNSDDGDIAGPVSLVLALERSLAGDEAKPAQASQRIVVAGDSDFLANGYIGVGANRTLGTNIVNWLSGDDDLIAVEVKSAPDTRLQLNDTEILFIGLGFFIVLPAALIAAGLIIWFKRRKR